MSSPLAVLRRLRPPAEADPLAGYAATRDPLLLAELVRRHGGLVWGVCRRTLPHRPDAEDAYQATWLVLTANPGAVREPAALPAFLHTVAVRACRRARQKRPLTASADHLSAPEPADRAALAALDEELARLPDRLRRPLVLCHLDGQTQAEAATALGLSLSTLKRRLETGKELLRARLAGRGIDAAAVLTAAGLSGVGAPAVVAGGAGVAATALSTEVLSAMWMLKAKGWAAGLVLAAGVATTGGGLMLAGGQGPGGGPAPAPAAKPADPPVATVRHESLASAPPANNDLVRAALEQTIRELERAAAAADDALAAQQRVADAYKDLPGVSTPEKLSNMSLVARYRENAALQRVEMAKVRVEIAKLGPPPAVSAAPAVPARLLKERIDTAREFIDLDRQIREVGAVSKEESSAFEINLRVTNQTLYDALRAADSSPAGQLAAAREWYVTARDAETFYRARAERGLNRAQVALNASLARNHAEAALLQAMAAAPQSARDGIAPFTAAPAGYGGKVTANTPFWTNIRPAAGLKPPAGPAPAAPPPGVKDNRPPAPLVPLTAVRVSRNGKPVGVLVVTHNPLDGSETAIGILLPNADGTTPAVQVGDDVRP